MKVFILEDRLDVGVYYREADEGIDSQGFRAASFVKFPGVESMAKKSALDYRKKIEEHFKKEDMVSGKDG